MAHLHKKMRHKKAPDPRLKRAERGRRESGERKEEKSPANNAEIGGIRKTALLSDWIHHKRTAEIVKHLRL
jgi:hypothetical protein